MGGPCVYAHLNLGFTQLPRISIWTNGWSRPRGPERRLGRRAALILLHLSLAVDDLLHQLQSMDSKCKHVLLTVCAFAGVEIDPLGT